LTMRYINSLLLYFTLLGGGRAVSSTGLRRLAMRSRNQMMRHLDDYRCSEQRSEETAPRKTTLFSMKLSRRSHLVHLVLLRPPNFHRHRGG